jgi:hypothetical protein
MAVMMSVSTVVACAVVGIMGVMKLRARGDVEEIVEVVVVVRVEDAKTEGSNIGGCQMEDGEGEMDVVSVVAVVAVDGVAHLGHQCGETRRLHTGDD